MIRASALACALFLALHARSPAAEPPSAIPPHAAAPTADPADVSSATALVRAVYSTISGPAGRPRDWARVRSLMAPDARFLVAGVAADLGVRRRALSVDEVANADKAFAREGFFEHGVTPHKTIWAHIATVVSPYESRHAEGEAPFARGINHFQLTSDGKRWFIESIMRQGESAAYPLPADAAAALNDR